ncbi:14255_t:CDS:1 [Cetraspora pellucida]|uniref:14255_t:CDS:1 n=1 Tax=Cetraspora pellucida TaxID=1433469 RepID=A0A9N9I366_9GLOM|nr:14255_t:CDS:1 [Cetraspora pellucida]
MSQTEPESHDSGKAKNVPPQHMMTTPTSSSTTVGLSHQRSDVNIDPHIKSYIDESIRISSSSVINSIKQYIDSQFDRQRSWNEQLQSNIDNMFAKLTQPDNSNSTIPCTLTSTSQATSRQHLHHPKDTPQPHTTEQASQDIQTTGNYPPTPTLNNLIMATSRVSLQPQSPIVTANQALPASASTKLPVLKSTSRKYPSINYAQFNHMHEIQSFSNPHAARTESIRIWWVTNWQEGKQIIESLPHKPNISTKLWKVIAFGSYINLQEFSYKNLLITIKETEKEPVLQSAEGGSISIKRRSRHAAFLDISE